MMEKLKIKAMAAKRRIDRRGINLFHKMKKNYENNIEDATDSDLANNKY